ncbi:MAG: PA0069 family radical SAM protein [Balneolaceae bacterium]
MCTSKNRSALRGRGVAANPKGRFESKEVTYTSERKRPKTTILNGHAAGIISTNASPDIPFDVSLNPYRGCEHGCAYCYARPTHEFLGMSAGLDFETKIVAKRDAPQLLRETIAKPSWKPQVLVMSGVTDPYQPVERELKLTRGCIQVLSETRHPLVIITKNGTVTRDIDLLLPLAGVGAVRVVVSVTSLDRDLIGVLEPRTSRPEKRLQAIRELSRAGIPVHVNIAPIIPGLNDTEVVSILEAVKEAGALSASYTLVRLPYGVKDLFSDWLAIHFPDRKEKVLNHIRACKGGVLNRSEFGDRFSGTGAYARQIAAQVAIHKKRLGLDVPHPPLQANAFRRPQTAQLRLF